MASTNVMSFVRSCTTLEPWYLANDLGFPDPFAVATIGGEQTKTTTVIKKTLNPYWNESFDMYSNLVYTPFDIVLTRYP